MRYLGLNLSWVTDLLVYHFSPVRYQDTTMKYAKADMFQILTYHS